MSRGRFAIGVLLCLPLVGCGNPAAGPTSATDSWSTAQTETNLTGLPTYGLVALDGGWRLLTKTSQHTDGHQLQTAVLWATTGL